MFHQESQKVCPPILRAGDTTLRAMRFKYCADPKQISVI
jgi:hypothetical protein